MKKEGGMIFGGESTSHANGGVKYIVKNTGKLIEAEGDEFVFCSEVTKSKRQHTFTGTPYEILIAIAKEYQCNVGELKGLNGGEFVICKKVIRDREPLTVSGTPTQIISYLQVEKGCNPHWSYDLEKADGETCNTCAHEAEARDNFRWNKDGISGFEDEQQIATAERGGAVKSVKTKKIPSSFETAARLLIDAHFNNTKIEFFGQPYLIHAEVKGTGMYTGRRFGHAWVEDKDLVYDFYGGKKVILPKFQYYKIADVNTKDPNKYQKYNYQQLAKKLLLSTDYCWGLKTKFEDGGDVLNFYQPDMFMVNNSFNEGSLAVSDSDIFANGGNIDGISFKQISHNIFAVVSKNQEVLAKMFVRFNSYLDSSEFKGSVFTLDEFKKGYANGGEFTYYSDFKGFNVPDYVFNVFFKGSFNPLSKEEQWLLHKIKPYDSKEPYYVIGYVDLHSEQDTVKHETAHAFYYLYPEYKQQVDAVLKRFKVQLSEAVLKKMYGFLEELKYEKSIWNDEVNAYLIADKAFLIQQNAWSDRFEKYSYELNKIFEKWHAKKIGASKFESGGSVAIATIPFKSLPHDMRVLITDLIGDNYGNDASIPAQLPIVTLNLSDIEDMPIGNDKSDSRDEQYAAEMMGQEMPPIICSHSAIVDGRHRTWSAKKEGKQVIQAIDLTAVDKDGLIAKTHSLGKVKSAGLPIKPDYRSLFQHRIIAAQNLAKELKNAYNGRLQINSDASITLYHLTGEQAAEKIKQNGFRAGAFFFASKTAKYNGDTLLDYRNKHNGYAILEVHLSPHDISFSSGTGEFYSENYLSMNQDFGFYEAK